MEDKLVQKFEKLSIEPSSQAWEKLNAKLASTPLEKQPTKKWYLILGGIAASLVLVVSATMFLYQNSSASSGLFASIGLNNTIKLTPLESNSDEFYDIAKLQSLRDAYNYNIE